MFWWGIFIGYMIGLICSAFIMAWLRSGKEADLFYENLELQEELRRIKNET